MFSTIICPKCQIETTLGISGVLGLKNNHTVISVINILEAFNAVSCSICQVKPATLQCHSCPEILNLCESCHSTEDSLHAFHDVRPLDLHSILSSKGKVRLKSIDDEEVIVECPRSIVGRVLSSPRNSFEKIRSDTQCTVDVRKLSDRESPAHIAIRGPKQRVKIAQSMVENIMDSIVSQEYQDMKISSGDDEEEDRTEYTIDVTYYEAIDIFELRFNYVQNISTQTNTDIKLIPSPSQDDRMRLIVIRPAVGSPYCRTDVARKLILKMIEETDADHEKRTRRPSLTDQGGPVTEVVVLTTLQYHKLASSGFAPLQRIAQRVGCRIDAKQDHQTCIIAIKGSVIQVREAKQLLKHVVDNRPHSFTPSTAGVYGDVPPGFSTPPTQRSPTPPRHSLSHDHMTPPTSFSGNQNGKRSQSFTHFPAMVSPSTGVRHDKSPSYFTFREPQEVSAKISCEYENIGKVVGVRGGRLDELRSLTDCQIIIKKGDSDVSCIIEIIGSPDKVAYAVPMIKMVLGSGDAVMTTVRSLLVPQDTEIIPPVPEKIPESLTRRDALSPMQLSNSLQRHAEDLEKSSSHSQSQSSTPRTISNLQPSSQQSSAPSTPSNGPLGSVLGPPLGAGEESDIDSDPGHHNQCDLSGTPTIPKSKTVLTPQKYNISPPPSPPPSTLFPKYFIPARNMKMMEQVCYPRAHLSKHRLQEIALFSRCKISSNARIPSISPPPYLPAAFGIASPTPPLDLIDQITLQLHGEPDQRELAKLLLEAAAKPNHYRSPGYSQKDGLDGVVRTMDCPPHFIPVLIGPGGATIESIQTQSNTKILINENVDADRPPTLSIIGTVTGVNAAVQILDRLVMNHRFKYRQMKAVLTESSRARSLPIMTRSNRENEPNEDEVEEDEDDFQNDEEEDREGEAEEGGRTLLTPSPIPSHQSAGAVLSMMSNQKRLAARNNQTIQLSNSSGVVSRQSSLSTISDCSGISSLELSRSSSNASIMYQGGPSPWNSPQSSPMRSALLSDHKSLPSITTTPRDLAPDSVETVIFCPMDKVAQVIGKRGSILRELKRLSNCEIIVNQGTDPVPSPLLLLLLIIA